METSINPQEQQILAKLNLLVLDDDYQKTQYNQCSYQNDYWGRSVETQSFFKEKLSQRYKLKRKSQRQSRIKPIFGQILQEKSKLSDKQSLKEILRKLDSKEMGTPREHQMKRPILSENNRFEREKEFRNNNNSNRTTIDLQTIDDQSYRKVLGESMNKGENYFASKKMEIMSIKRIGKISNDESYLSIEGPFMQGNGQNKSKKREFFTECKHAKRFKNRIRKNTQNKENETMQFAEYPIDIFRGGDELKKKLFINNNTKNSCGTVQEINKRTFHILQQINRTKSINLGKSMNLGCKLGSESIKLKKSQMAPYSKVLKEKSNCLSKQKREKSKVFMQSKDNMWVKLQIRG